MNASFMILYPISGLSGLFWGKGETGRKGGGGGKGER